MHYQGATVHPMFIALLNQLGHALICIKIWQCHCPTDNQKHNIDRKFFSTGNGWKGRKALDVPTNNHRDNRNT